jgi:hypothetical protein
MSYEVIVVCVCVCLSKLHLFHLFKQLTDFYETWYEYYAIGGHPSAVVRNFVYRVVT